MTKRVLLLILSMCVLGVSYAQKAQTFAYIDMEYILENIPDYQEANQQITLKVKKWQGKISKEKNEIEILKTNLDNERALLTNDLIEDREEDIAIRQEELNKIQEMYFGTKGDLYRLRKQFVKPVQDQVYNAIQEIAKQSKYDFVLDKSSDLIMLYSNKRFDISERIVRSIVRTEKKKDLNEKRSKKQRKLEEKQNDSIAVNPEVAQKMEDRANKRKELQERIEAQKAERLRLREEKRKEIEAQRQKIIEEREEKRKQKGGNINTIETKQESESEKEKEKTTDTVEKIEEEVEDTIEENAEKTADTGEKAEPKIEETVEEKAEEIENAEEIQRKELQARIEAQKAERNAKREARLKEIEEARQKKIKEREEARKRIEAKRDSIIKARNNPE